MMKRVQAPPLFPQSVVWVSCLNFPSLNLSAAMWMSKSNIAFLISCLALWIKKNTSKRRASKRRRSIFYWTKKKSSPRLRKRTYFFAFFIVKGWSAEWRGGGSTKWMKGSGPLFSNWLGGWMHERKKKAKGFPGQWRRNDDERRTYSGCLFHFLIFFVSFLEYRTKKRKYFQPKCRI